MSLVSDRSAALRYAIVYDKPGRIRFRLGRDVFTKEQGYGIEETFFACPFVVDAAATAVNGGLLVHYRPGHRADVVGLLEGLDRHALPEGERKDSNVLREMDEEFANALIDIFLMRMFFKFFVPAPIGMFFLFKSAAKYWKRGIDALARGNMNVDVLDAVSIGVAISQKDFKTASSVMMLLRITALLGDYTKKKVHHSLSRSLSMNVDSVWARVDGAEVQMPLEDVRIDDVIRVRSGNIIPLDGEVVEGEATVNEASMTGEAMPVVRSFAHSVFAGTVVDEGSICIKVRSLANDTRIQNIVNMIDTSERLKANIHSNAEKLADNIVPFSFVAFFGALFLTRDMPRAMSVLMVDYSCAIRLSTPICIMTSIKNASNRRILIKGGKHIESFATANVAVFDKTGTLTWSCPTVAKVVPFEGYERSEVLKISACLEEHFPHSVAKAIVRRAEAENLEHQEEHADVEYIVAHGIASSIGEDRVVIGSRHFICDHEGVPLSDENAAVIERETQGYSTVYLAIGGKAAGCICVQDPPRPEAARVLDNLAELGLDRMIMLTGDSEAAAKIVAEELGIKEYRSQMLPEQKALFVKELKDAGNTVIMVGDGVNDSPALSQADVSVAMKDGADLAKEVSDIVILDENLEGLVVLRKLSNELIGRVNGNYKVIVGFNTSLIALGLGGLLPASVGAVLHNLSTMFLSWFSTRPYESIRQ
ncbi:MAG: heavy metal translocating P-type ATPase [Defluviitaleaceae bacterium]|nr:heavy metal translocating P-type ATPase [Defluviitaleaceae bacterium]